ncbi:MAG: alpha-L-arabinofuranosidase C-terminal domain-containing protein [Sphingomicrobium sp.]
MKAQGIRRALAALVAALIVVPPATAQAPRTTIAVNASTPGAKIDRRIFGQFAEHLGSGIYGGIWVGEDSKIPNTNGYRNDVVAALKALQVPVVRWPGGCFADEYNWREGIGPRPSRPVKINTNWGGVTEDNAFGTNEFMNFAEMIGAETYVSGNVGNGTPREMAEWVEYMTAPAGSLADLRKANGRAQPWKLTMMGIGNELWGCGGNMRAEYAADETRRFSTFIKVPAGTKTLKIASGANSTDYNWTEVMMREARGQFDGIGVHYYTIGAAKWPPAKPATGFGAFEYANILKDTLRMEEIVTKHSAIMDKYDPQKRVILAVDEWGSWYAPTPGSNPGFLVQQNSIRDAILAALNFNIFARHADRVRMANIAQMVNVLQAMIMTDGGKMVLTPTYHAFRMYIPFQNATFVPVSYDKGEYREGDIVLPRIDAIAARGTDGHLYLAVTNLDASAATDAEFTLGVVAVKSASGETLTAPAVDSVNTFAKPDLVAPRPIQAKAGKGKVTVTLPPRSVTVLRVN